MPCFAGKAIVAEATVSGYESIKAILRENNVEPCVHARTAAEALRAVQENRCEILVANMVLPGMDALALAQIIYTMPLRLYPGIIVRHVGLAPAEAAARFSQAGGVLLKWPANAQAMQQAVEAVHVYNRPVLPHIKLRLQQMLNRLAVPAHCGRDFLEHAILLSYLDRRLCQSLTGTLYPAVAARFGVTNRRVEQAMRHVIDIAWQSNALDVQYDIFRGTIDAQRGKPTCGEMIAQLADILRLEE